MATIGSLFTMVQAGQRKTLAWATGVLCLFGFLAGPSLAAQEVEPEDVAVFEIVELMRQLPPPAQPVLRDIQPDDDAFKELGPAVAVQLGTAVRLQAESIFAQGPEDGLEVLLCLQGGKNHEALAWTPTGNAQLVKTAFLLALELEDGQVTDEESGLPARGTPVRVVVRWQPDVFLEPDRWVEVDASQLVRNRGTSEPFPPLPYVYTGSQIRAVPNTDADGEVVMRERFMLEYTKSVVVNYDEPDALLASPFPIAARDLLFEVNSQLAPVSRTPMRFIFTRVKLPLELQATVDGDLSHGDSGVLDDANLAALLRQTYHADHRSDPEQMAAVAIQIPAEAPRTLDAALRLRMLNAAVAAESWVVPIFVPLLGTQR